MAEAHVRIDEGIKRGPKKQRIALKRPTEPITLSPIIPATLDPREVLERYLSEPRTSQIAESYGVTRSNLVRWLREVVPDEWKQVQIVRALIFKEDGNEGLDNADNALMLARAREMVKSAQWELERLDSKNYGAKQEVTVVNEVRLETVLDGVCTKLLEKIGASQQVLQVIDVQADTLQHDSDKTK